MAHGAQSKGIAATLGATAGGVLRMAEAAASDIAGALHLAGTPEPTGDGQDPFTARDPAYIRDTLAAVGLGCETYFRGEVDGLENIPEEGPVLLVGNHSGGTLIADTFVFAHAFYERFGPDRLFHQLAHDMVFAVPGIRSMVMRWGTVPAHPDNMRRALADGAALLVYPGGDHETYRPSWESADIDFAGREGFAKLALELDVPIVPVVAIGGQETALFLGQGRGLARRLGLDRALRLKVLPAQIAPPLGLTVLDLPIRFPLPAKISVRVLPRITLRDRLGKRPSAGDAYDLVTGVMQGALDELDEERALPILG